VHEIKFDGYRLLTRVDGADIKLFTRNGNDWTSKLVPLQKAIAKAKLPAGWYDGEMVMLNEKGVPDFGALQQSFDAAKTSLWRQTPFALLILGLIGSQTVTSAPAALHRTIALATMFALSFIMIHVGYEFEMDKSRVRSYAWDYLVAASAEDLAADLCGIIAEQERQERQNVLDGRPTSPLQIGLLLGCRSFDAVGHSRVCERSDAVDRYAIAGHLQRCDPRERKHPSLRCGVVGLPDVADQSRGGDQIDKPSGAGLLEVLQRRPHTKKRAAEVSREHLRPGVIGHVEKHPVAGNRGSVYPRIEAAKLLQR
jgi:hypothetical protein